MPEHTTGSIFFHVRKLHSLDFFLVKDSSFGIDQ